MKHVLIAGGSGLIGKKLTLRLLEKGYDVSTLSRTPNGPDQYYWNPQNKQIDCPILDQVDVLINLSGAGIADKKWSNERKLELQNSRVGTNIFLFSLVEQMPNLKQFICSSGINAYGFIENKECTEEDPFGNDFLSQLVRVWELSAEQFSANCKVAKIRTAMVLSSTGGALSRLLPIVKMGIGSAIGNGKQASPWIHIDDLVEMFVFAIENDLDGSYNALAANESNKELMKTIASVLNKPFWFPNVPAFMLRWMFGEMSLILLKGVRASNTKIVQKGFVFQFPNLKDALTNLLKK